MAPDRERIFLLKRQASKSFLLQRHLALPNLRSSPRGFTLLELLITMSIMVAVIIVVLPRARGPEGELKSMIRKFAVLVKELNHSARLNNSVYRIVFDMGVGDGPRDQSFWVERTSRNVTIPTLEQKEQTLKQERNRSRSEEDEKPKDPDGFTLDPRFTKKPEKLPRVLKVSLVERLDEKESVSEGKTAVYFFPQGAAEEVIIHLKSGEKLHWSLVVHPLAGRADIVEGGISFRDLQN